MSKISEESRHLVFTLGAEEYAIPLLTVREVIGFPDVTPVPQSPSHFLGIMNLRGQVISIIDLRLKFGLKEKRTEETSVIILEFKDNPIGVVVDSVNSVLSASSDKMSPPPEIDGGRHVGAITGVYRKESSLVLLLDIAKTLSKEDVARTHHRVSAKAA